MDYLALWKEYALVIIIVAVILIMVIVSFINVMIKNRKEQEQKEWAEAERAHRPALKDLESEYMTHDFLDLSYKEEDPVTKLKQEKEAIQEDIKKKLEMHHTAVTRYKEIIDIGKKLKTQIQFLKEKEQMIDQQIRQRGGII